MMENFSLYSFISGTMVGVVAMLFSGFAGEAGKDLYIWLKKRIGEPDPIKVSIKYIPQVYPADQCVWVREESIPVHEEQESFFYPHPKNRGGKCYREVASGGVVAKEFLMVRKGA